MTKKTFGLGAQRPFDSLTGFSGVDNFVSTTFLLFLKPFGR
ncbi:hypothetical protein [Bacillus sp. FJAT-27225]|nr:hypothetical protein [Bacillus sp. FJAT-27225]